MAELDASSLIGGEPPTKHLVPIHKMGEGSGVVRDVLRTGRPAVVTDNGDEVAVIVDAATFQAMRDEMALQRLRADLDAAIAEADAGMLIDHAEAMAEMSQLLQERARANSDAGKQSTT